MILVIDFFEFVCATYIFFINGYIGSLAGIDLVPIVYHIFGFLSSQSVNYFIAFSYPFHSRTPNNQQANLSFYRFPPSNTNSQVHHYILSIKTLMPKKQICLYLFESTTSATNNQIYILTFFTQYPQ